MQHSNNYKLTLSSHPGKALVMKEKVDHFGGHDVNWFTIGDEQKALEVHLKYHKGGHCFITYKRHGGEEGHSFDCAHGKFDEGTQVPGYHNHQGGNQWFIVNQDKTVSPTHSPYMVLGIRNDELILVNETDNQNKLVFNELKPSYDLESLKVLRLVSTQHDGKGIVVNKDSKRCYGHGMDQYFEIGDDAISIFVDEHDHIHWTKYPSLVFDGYRRTEGGIDFYMFTNHLEYDHHKFIVNKDGTISLMSDTEYVIGTCKDKKKTQWVKKGDPNQLVFSDARKKLGVEEQYAQADIKRAKIEEQKKLLKQPFTLKNGIEVRYSKEIGGDKNTNHEIFEWPTNDQLNSMSKEQLENFHINQIKWVKGTHSGPQEDYCNSLRFVSSVPSAPLYDSPLFGEKDPNDLIDVSKTRIAKICGKTNFHHAFCYKFFDDFDNVIDKPIFSKYNSETEQEFSIEIGTDEKLIGFRVQLSDWVDCKISKIWFKIAKCQQKGVDYASIETRLKEIKEEKKKALELTKKLLEKSNWQKQSQVWFIEKHNGERFIQHNNSDGTYEAFREGTEEKVDSGNWSIEGTTYAEKDGSWKGQITMKSEKDYIVDFYAGEHGYHKYTAIFESYEKGYTSDQMKLMRGSKADTNNEWFVLHYTDFCYGDASSESCESFEEAIQLVMKKPKKSNVAYQYWVDHRRLFTKPTGHGAIWTNEHAVRHVGQCHLFVCGKNMNHEINGRTLIKLDNVEISGGDGHIDEDVYDEKSALELVKNHKNSDIAYFWCNRSNRLIQKPPDKQAGRWNSQHGAFYMYADKVLGNGQSYLYSKVNITKIEEIEGLLRTQQWQSQEGHVFSFQHDNQGKIYIRDQPTQELNWVITHDNKVQMTNHNESKLAELVCKQGILSLQISDGETALTRASQQQMNMINKQLEEETFSLDDVANDPQSYLLYLSGHHDHPACNGKYHWSDRQINGRNTWNHEESKGLRVQWTGRSWDCHWGGYSPEAPVDTPIPPASGYTIDQGSCEIKVEYKRRKLDYTLEDVAREPSSFTLHMTGHHDHPACNGKYTCNGEKENGKLKWTHSKSSGVKLFWTGGSWDCFWGGYSPESGADTVVPPLTGYDRDKGSTDIKVRYELKNGFTFDQLKHYNKKKIKINSFEQVFSIICAQGWADDTGATLEFLNYGKGKMTLQDKTLNNFNWIITPDGKIIMNSQDYSQEFRLLNVAGEMQLESDDEDVTYKAKSNPSKDEPKKEEEVDEAFVSDMVKMLKTYSNLKKEDIEVLLQQALEQVANEENQTDVTSVPLGHEGWFVVQYSDFKGGDESSEACTSYEKACQLIKNKPRRSNIAYQFSNLTVKMFTKPIGRGAKWEDESSSKHPDAGHLFLYGTSLGVSHEGRLLIKIEGVDTCGGDGAVQHGVSDKNDATQRVINKKGNSKVAHFWHQPSKRLIEKPPNRGASWSHGDGTFYIYVDKVVSDTLTGTESNEILEELGTLDVGANPKDFTLHLSGHNGNPACNGKYSANGEKENGKYVWTHQESQGVKLVWTGGTWDICWGGFSPESATPCIVPPFTGYDIDKGNCEIKVQYLHKSGKIVTRADEE